MSTERIGTCEGFCGRVDHHLVHGLCSECRQRASDYSPEEYEYDPGLGYEAYVGSQEIREGLQHLDASFRSRRD